MSGRSDGFNGIIYLIGIGGFFVFRGFKNLKLHKKVSGLATSRARSMAMGLVELSGIAKNVSPALDPVYSLPCSYFNLKVEQYRRSGKRGNWVTIHQSNSDNKPFLCKDLTGEVLIMPNSPEVHFTNKIEIQNSLFGKRDETALAFLRSRWNGTLKLTLNVLREGDPIFIIGSALTHRTTASNPESPYGSVSISEASKILKKDVKAMQSIDTNKDGQIDTQEWDDAVEKYRKFLEAKKNPQGPSEPQKSPLIFNGLVTKTPEHDLIFANSEEDLLSKTGPWAYLQIIGGGAALIGGVVLLAIQMNLL